MAKVIGPLHSSEARGAVGSLVYNTWRGISYAKSRSGPTVTQSEDQQALRALTAAATTAWQALSDIERRAWDYYATEHVETDWTGNGKRLSGYNWFVRLNVRAQLIEQSISDSPPTEHPAYLLEGLIVDQFPPYIRARCDEPVQLSDLSLYLELWVTDSHSAGRHMPVELADRKSYCDVADQPALWRYPGPGIHTAFCRFVLANGIAYPFQHKRVQVT